MIEINDLEKSYDLIPVEELNISLDENETIGYDFTVEDFYTFSTSDGIFIQDTMAIFLPITQESQQEARTKMMNHRTVNTNEIAIGLSKEMFVGLYIMTKDTKSNKPHIVISDEDLKNISDPFIPVIYRGNKTTSGRAIFNNCLPRDYKFFDEQITKKIVGGIILDLVKRYPQEVVDEAVTRIEQTAFKFATIAAPNVSIDQLEMPKEIYQIKEKLKTATVEEAVVLIEKAEKIMKEHLKDSGIYDLAESGSTKGWGQPSQILIAKGIIADASGKILDPISGSFADGFNNTEFFNASSGARSGIIDRVKNTADTGYMARKLAYVLNTVEADLYLQDCKTRRTFAVKLDKDTISRFSGRYVIQNGRVMRFEEANFKIGDVAHLRTPIYCESDKICHTCYGELLRVHKSPYIGVLASQVLAEKSTQGIMRNFHTGGAVKVIKQNILEDILNNDPLIELE